jgi:hypothetical protein
VDEEAVKALLPPLAASATARRQTAEIAVQYLQTLEHAALLDQPSVSVSLEGVSVTFLRGVHYFASVAEQQGFTA